MASNSFGTLFKITTWGESHGKAIGVVIDGCPAGLDFSEEDIQRELNLRKPNQNAYTSSRKEPDRAEILSGLFEGKTTGAPLSIIIFNQDAKSDAYKPLQNILRAGHANYTYLEKYGLFDYRGGGRASARETACRVAAGALAKKLLAHFDISILAYVKEIGGISGNSIDASDLEILRKKIHQSPVFCPDDTASALICKKIDEIKSEGDSLGGIIELISSKLPVGLGDPLYEKLEAKLAGAMLSIPASKGFEIGSGFEAARKKGSENNDLFTVDEKGNIITSTNHAGGTLGGISTGMPLICRIAFKPTSSISKTQQSIDTQKQPVSLTLPNGSRHDPCLTIRAVPVVEAMAALVLADSLLMHRNSRI